MLLTMAMIGSFLYAFARKFRQAVHLGRDDYGVTEWLINYSGGFVRRGWPGEVIATLSQVTGWQANYIVLFLSAVALVWLSLLLIVRAGKHFPLILLFSSVLLAMPLHGNFVIRKDVSGMLLLAWALGIRRRIASFPLRVAALNLVVVAAILSHESFFFYAVPALIVLLMQDLGGGIRRLPAAAALMTPALLAFVLCVIYKGDAAIAQTIHDSWGGLWWSINPSDCCLSEPGGSIEGLRWSSAQALALPYSLLSTFAGGLYVPLAWVLVMAACFLLLTALVKPCVSGDRGRLAGVLLFQLFAILPLFVVGWDFGRWIFFWTCSSVLLYAEHANLSGRISLALDTGLAWMGWLSSRCRPLLYASCLFLGAPLCCWPEKDYLMWTPLGSVLHGDFVRRLLALAF